MICHRFFAMLLSATLVGMLTLSSHAAAKPLPPDDVEPARRQEIVKRSLVTLGDTNRLARVIQQAKRGEPVVLGFIGGSITQGAGANPQEARYSDQFVQWWSSTFPDSKVTQVNAGIGATGSDYGTFRVQDDLLVHEPDLVIVEYSVNEQDDAWHLQTMEGLLRQILAAPNQPAVIMLHTMRKDGSNAQAGHGRVGDHYKLPRVSYRDALWPEVEAKRIGFKQITADSIHPNNAGHQWAGLFITHLVEQVADQLSASSSATSSASPARTAPKALPEPLTTDVYQFTRTYHFDYRRETGVLLKPDSSEWNHHGTAWRGRAVGQTITFTVPEAEVLAIRYWRFNRPWMAKVEVKVNDREPVIVDGWTRIVGFAYDSVKVIGEDLGPGPHTVRMTVLEDRTDPNKPDPDHKNQYMFVTKLIFAAGVSEQPDASAAK